MRKVLSIVCMSVLYFNAATSQDLIINKAGEELKAKVVEVTDNEIKYYKSDNINGPLYSTSSSSIFRIVYANGNIDTINRNAVIIDENYLKVSKENPKSLLKKGNNVYIEILDEASRAGEKYFLEAFKTWNYWNVVQTKSEAHFLLEFNIDKKAMMDKAAQVIFKTRDGKEFQKSKFYRSSTSAFNGYNAFRAAAHKVVEKYLRKKFK